MAILRIKDKERDALLKGAIGVQFLTIGTRKKERERITCEMRKAFGRCRELSLRGELGPILERDCGDENGHVHYAIGKD